MLRNKSSLLSTIIVVFISALLLSCYPEFPLPPDQDQPYETNGTIGERITTYVDMEPNADTGAWTSMVRLTHRDHDIFPQVKLVADKNLIDAIRDNSFNIPGKTTVNLGNRFSFEVTVTEETENTYRVTIENPRDDAAPPVSFLIDNLGDLSKASTTLSAEKTGIVDPEGFAGFLGTHMALFCHGGPLNVFFEALECLKNAMNDPACTNFENIYIEVRITLSSGCLDIEFKCGCHDQGGVGF